MESTRWRQYKRGALSLLPIVGLGAGWVPGGPDAARGRDHAANTYEPDMAEVVVSTQLSDIPILIIVVASSLDLVIWTPIA